MLAFEASRCSREMVWQQHIVRWERSGLTQSDYCAQAGVTKSSFSKWKQRLSRGDGPQLVEVWCLTAPPRSGLCLVLGGGQYRLEIGGEVSVEALDAVLTVLEARL